MSCEGSSLGATILVSIYGIACNALIANYAKHEHVEEALKWFISMYHGIAGYAEHGPFSEVLK